MSETTIIGKKKKDLEKKKKEEEKKKKKKKFPFTLNPKGLLRAVIARRKKQQDALDMVDGKK